MPGRPEGHPLFGDRRIRPIRIERAHEAGTFTNIDAAGGLPAIALTFTNYLWQ